MLLQIGRLILSHLILPTIFLTWLSFGSEKNKIDELIKLLAVFCFSIFIFLYGRWDWLSYYLRIILIILLFIATFKCYNKLRRLTFNTKREFNNWLTLGINSSIIITFSIFNILILQGYFFNQPPVQLTFPLQNGIYYVAHGGNSPMINHHNSKSAQHYALDIVKLNRFGTRVRGVYPQQLMKYAIFGQPLYSSCNGKVQEKMDGLPDLNPPKRDRKHPAGNSVLIRCQDVDISVLIAHLKSGSIVVEKGNKLREGQLIGKVGNSGNTSEPHLHIHAIAGTGSSILGGEGVPMIFNDRFLVRNSLVWK
jgi:hypothetical protein